MIILASVVFVPSRGFLFFYAKKSCNSLESWVFVPSRGFLFFYRIGRILEEMVWGFRPLTGISLFLWLFFQFLEISFVLVFVPSRGFLFFYKALYFACWWPGSFSSPHGDFSFSIKGHKFTKPELIGFRPLTGISLFLYENKNICRGYQKVFVPSRGFLFFYWVALSLHPFFPVFVPSRGFLFFYPISYSPYKSRAIFIICGANIFKPSECYF